MDVSVKDLLGDPDAYARCGLTLSGWVRTVRDSKAVGFLELNDGSSFRGVQVVFGPEIGNFRDVARCGVGSSVTVRGRLVPTPEA
ncbi:MAG: OB-fold nucleic acid binding domain-containing protein, partial [Oscillospiraceae bacterium]|nr:OB-fold nucleic acid binding domain-containing protein [Oscillospiraceae bacterium]